MRTPNASSRLLLLNRRYSTLSASVGRMRVGFRGTINSSSSPGNPGYPGFPGEDEELIVPLNPTRILPTDAERVEYLRFNKRSREDALGVRIDYQFTQRMSVLAGFQFRKFTNRDDAYEDYLDLF